MSRKKKAATTRTTDLDLARNDLFGHINRCGVLRADEEQQVEWMEDTIDYIAECYPSLTDEELADLKAIGLRFCRPPIAHGAESNALTGEDQDQPGEGEVAASAA